MKKTYINKIANIKELEALWDRNVAEHPGDNRWVLWRTNALNNARSGKSRVYITLDGDKIIGEMSAMFYNDDPNLANGVDRVYLEAFRIKEEYRGKGVFSSLHKFAEQDLIDMGYTCATLGVEPEEEYNIAIYNHWGYNKFIKSTVEQYEPKQEGEEGQKYTVNYYGKSLSDIDCD